MLTRDVFDSPVRPLRQPRFSSNGSQSPNENCPAHAVNRNSSTSTFPRQFASSPAKAGDRNVLLLLGNKISSSVPGRRSSIACARDRKALVPILAIDEESSCDVLNEALMNSNQRRSKSVKPCTNAQRGQGGKLKTLRRLWSSLLHIKWNYPETCSDRSFIHILIRSYESPFGLQYFVWNRIIFKDHRYYSETSRKRIIGRNKNFYFRTALVMSKTTNDTFSWSKREVVLYMCISAYTIGYGMFKVCCPFCSTFFHPSRSLNFPSSPEIALMDFLRVGLTITRWICTTINGVHSDPVSRC